MIVGPGLFVPAELAGAVAEALAADLRRQPRADVRVLALLREAAALARAAGGPVASGGVRATRGLTPAEAGRMLGLTANAVRRRLSEGRLAGEKVEGRWLVQL
jgi:hypothetical protein